MENCDKDSIEKQPSQRAVALNLQNPMNISCFVLSPLDLLFNLNSKFKFFPSKPDQFLGNKRSRRSKRPETPSPGREENRTRDESTGTGNITLTNTTLYVESNLGEPDSGNRLVDPSQISN